MSIPGEILLITSGVGALQSAFFSVYLFSLRKGRQLTNLFLASLLLAFAIRVTKSVTYYFAEDHEVPRLLQNIGYAANLAILPLLWLYLNAFFRDEYKFNWKKDGIHLLPPAVAILLSPILTPYFWMNQHGYTISLLVMGTYVPFCFYLVYKHFSTANSTHRIWALCLAVGVTAVWAGYTANFIFHIVSYITGPVIFSFVAYLMTYLGLKQSNIFLKEQKYINSTIPSAEIERCFEKIGHVMIELEPFKDTSLTLSKLAKQLGVSPHMLSETINKKAGQNFPDFINGYRIRNAQALLFKKENSHQKIAAIAFETGFNSLSAFNAAFKKVTKMTPSEYRKTANPIIAD
jgi:AraC-like DNA-binding protein